jgi:succinyl-CoA synthetase beta subunit
MAGIMRCDYIAEGVIKATRELGLSIPLVVRLKGTKEAEAKQYVHRFAENLKVYSPIAFQDDQRIWSEDYRI